MDPIWKARLNPEPSPYADKVVTLPLDSLLILLERLDRFGPQHFSPRVAQHLTLIREEVAAVKHMVDNPQPPGIRIVEEFED